MYSKKPRRQSIFISGSYRSKYGLLGVLWNIYKAWKAGRKLVRQGYSVFIPHLNTCLMDNLQPADFFLDCCLKELRHFEVIFMLRDWEFSEGARQEWLEAKKRGLAVWYEGEPYPEKAKEAPVQPVAFKNQDNTTLTMYPTSTSTTTLPNDSQISFTASINKLVDG